MRTEKTFIFPTKDLCLERKILNYIPANYGLNEKSNQWIVGGINLRGKDYHINWLRWRLKKVKSYKPVPSHWGKNLTKFEHYCCHMLREAGCDCDIPKIEFPANLGFEGMNNIVWCGKCDIEAQLNVTEEECGSYRFPPLDNKRK